MKSILILIGPPGSGKGTLSQLCVDRLGWSQFSTGNACRKEISEGTEIGKQIDFAIKSGKLVSDGLIIEMVRNYLIKIQDNINTVILDGFPRTVAQAQELNNMLGSPEFSSFSLKVVRLVLSDEVIIKRLSSRLICENSRCQTVYTSKEDMKCDKCSGNLVRRPDDEPAAIRERLMIYHKHENELIDFYKNKNVLEELFVDKNIEEVYREFVALAGK